MRPPVFGSSSFLPSLVAGVFRASRRAFRLAVASFFLVFFVLLAGCRDSEPGADYTRRTESDPVEFLGDAPRSTPRLVSTPRPTPPAPEFVGDSLVVHLLMREYGVLPPVLLLPSEKRVTLLVFNRGSLPHDFMAGRAPASTRDGFGTDLFAGLDVEVEVCRDADVVAAAGPDKRSEAAFSAARNLDAADLVPGGGFRVGIPPGGAAYLTFTLPADRRGRWEFASMREGHYEAGLRGQLIVE